MLKRIRPGKDRAEIPVLKRRGPGIQCYKGQGRNSSVKRDRTRNPMLERIGPEFQCLKGKGQESNVRKERARIPMLESKRLEC